MFVNLAPKALIVLRLVVLGMAPVHFMGPVMIPLAHAYVMMDLMGTIVKIPKLVSVTLLAMVMDFAIKITDSVIVIVTTVDMIAALTTVQLHLMSNLMVRCIVPCHYVGNSNIEMPLKYAPIKVLDFQL